MLYFNIAGYETQQASTAEITRILKTQTQNSSDGNRSIRRMTKTARGGFVEWQMSGGRQSSSHGVNWEVWDKNRLPHCGFEDPLSCLSKRLRIWLAQGRASWPFQIEEKKMRPLLFLFQTCLGSPSVTISHPCDSYLMSEARNQPTLPFYWKVRFLKRKHVLSKRNVDRGERRCNYVLRNLVRTLQQKHVFAQRITWISPSSPKNHLPSGDRLLFHPRCGICDVLFFIKQKTCTNENIPQLCPRFRWLTFGNNKFEVIWNRRRVAQDVSHIPKCSMNQIRIYN